MMKSSPMRPLRIVFERLCFSIKYNTNEARDLETHPDGALELVFNIDPDGNAIVPDHETLRHFEKVRIRNKGMVSRGFVNHHLIINERLKNFKYYECIYSMFIREWEFTVPASIIGMLSNQTFRCMRKAYSLNFKFQLSKLSGKGGGKTAGVILKERDTWLKFFSWQ